MWFELGHLGERTLEELLIIIIIRDSQEHGHGENQYEYTIRENNLKKINKQIHLEKKATRSSVAL